MLLRLSLLSQVHVCVCEIVNDKVLSLAGSNATEFKQSEWSLCI